MSNYDTNSTQYSSDNGHIFGPSDTQIPFTAYLRVVPVENQGRRMVTVRDLSQTARMIEDDLSGWNIAKPVSYNLQFGNSTGRITINGIIVRDNVSVPNFRPADPVNKISSGTVPGERTQVFNGDAGGGNLSKGQDTSAQLDVLAAEIKTALEADSDIIGENATVDNMLVMGVKYGRGGRSFPIL
jgi:hypothetical protein